MPEKPSVIDARQLRAEGKVAGTRPEVPLKQTPLEIKGIRLEDAPKGPVDVVLILGMGPVAPYMVGVEGHREVDIENSNMRNNAWAAAQVIKEGMIKKDGIVVPSGTATADPKAVEEALHKKDREPDARNAFIASLGEGAKNLTDDEIDQRWTKSMRSLPNKNEIEQVFTTTEAGLMERLLLKSFPKGIEVVPDNLATETLDNFINLLNMLDEKSRTEKGAMSDATIAVITSQYHIARSMEIARFLNIGDKVVPLVSQEVLRDSGYTGRLRSQENVKFDEATRWNEQKWIRTIFQLPEYSLPVLATVKDDERLRGILNHVKQMYGQEVFDRHNIPDATSDNMGAIRLKLASIVRENPKEEEWMKTDTKEVNAAIDSYVAFAHDWFAANSHT